MLLLLPGDKLNFIISEAELTELFAYSMHADKRVLQRGDLWCILVSDFTGTCFKVF